MKIRTFLPATLIALMAAAPAFANCFADYKAKRENPLRLHYGVIELNGDACNSKKKAAKVIEKRIGKDGWALLNVMSIFDDAGLEERKESAGKFFLRY